MVRETFLRDVIKGVEGKTQSVRLQFLLGTREEKFQFVRTHSDQQMSEYFVIISFRSFTYYE